jgi:hypothetical protein
MLRKALLLLIVALLVFLPASCDAPGRDMTESNSEDVEVLPESRDAEKSEEPEDMPAEKQIEPENKPEKPAQNSEKPEDKPENIKKNPVTAPEAPAPENQANNNPEPEKKREASNNVTISIIDADSNREILHAISVEINPDDTVFDVLKRVTRERKIHMEFTGAGKSVYIEGIDNLYEFDRGARSGWVYSVNGVTAPVSAGDMTLSPGDVVVWEYREKADTGRN